MLVFSYHLMLIIWLNANEIVSLSIIAAFDGNSRNLKKNMHFINTI
jgi:hypothetical protein